MKARRAPGPTGAGYPSQPTVARGRGSIIRSSIVRSHHDPSTLLISVHPQRGAVRVVPSGELDLANAGALRAQLDELRAAGFEHVVLDLRDLTFMDSSGVRLILREDRLARSAGRRFALIAGIPSVQRVLTVCGVARRLEFDDPFVAPTPTRVPLRHGDFERPRLGIAFQGYVAQLRRQGRSGSRLTPR